MWLCTLVACGGWSSDPGQEAPNPAPRAPAPAAVAAQQVPAAPSPSASSDTHLLVLAETTTHDDALRELERTSALWQAVEFALPLPAGFPKILDRRSVPSLPPGRFLVVAGACTADTVSVGAATLKSLVPEGSVQQVRWTPDGPACPHGQESGEWGSGGFGAPSSASIAGGLTVLAFPYSYTEGEETESRWIGVALLRDDEEGLAATTEFESRGAFATLRGIRAEEGQITIRDEWADDVCTGAQRINLADGIVTVYVEEGLIRVTTAQANAREHVCPPLPEAGP